MSTNMQNTFVNEMEQQLLLLSEKVTHMENIIEKQSKQIKSQNHVLYCLIGGLFNQTTQGNTIASHLELLFDDFTQEDKEYYSRDEFNQFDKWSVWPTTRQGDENEQRIEQLETKLNTILEIIHEEEEEVSEYEEPEECEGIELQECVQHSVVSNDSSIPDLIENSETSSVITMTDDTDDDLAW
jgi:hypothetical protein